MSFELYPKQQEHCARIWESLIQHGCHLDASDTGVGKTLCGVDTAWNLGRRPVVICPKAVIPSWHKWLGQRSWRNAPIVVNYERVRGKKTPLWDGGWKLGKEDLLIFDEVQRCKSHKSQTMKLLETSRDVATLCLSATAASSPLDMKALGHRFGLFHKPSDWWRWCLKHGCKRGTWGGLEFYGGKGAMTHIHKALADKMSRLRREDIPEFPDTLIVDDPIDFGDDLRELWEDLEEKLASIPTANERITQILRARQRAELLKVPYLLEAVEDARAEGEQVAIFLNFHDSMDAVISKLFERGVVAEEFSGRTLRTRDRAAEDFCEDKLGVIVVQNASGGAGLSLHGKKPRHAFHSPTWSADTHRQVLGRVHRAGGNKSIQRILTCGAVEERVQKLATKKGEYIDILNGS